jgi:hypothetical protein
VAVVTGAAGERVGDWRRRNDPEQARRLPPHATLCYWAPPLAPQAYPLLEAQVRHAFDAPVTVHLGGVAEFDNTEHTFYLRVEETDALDRARARLYDGTHLALPRREAAPDAWWTWHVTCRARRARARPRGLATGGRGAAPGPALAGGAGGLPGAARRPVRPP